ncbi:C6 zinc finger domain-containing protein [Phlyctema vagabunda]|uniref:C6 zinc finger domain-containing protein n=1 Tax=Phlyctema vagabunda TaxID=108571 RepID=A0ABR4PRJ7_9HELO
MVYCGKVSKSCKQCRKRDIKCDKKRASCGQCVRAGIPCPGYSDTTEFVFMDSTETTIQKSTKQIRAAISKPMQQMAENSAKMYWVARYVLADASYFDYMKSFLPRRSHYNHMDAAVYAVGLALFSKEFGVPSMLQEARRKYCSALVLTNRVLQDASLATDNSTLATVLLLGLFERFTREDPKPREGIGKHMDGAIAIAAVRGPTQFSDPIGLRIFQQLAANIVMSCLERDMPIPAKFQALRAQANLCYNQVDSEWRFLDLMMDFIAASVAVDKDEVHAENLDNFQIIDLRLNGLSETVSSQILAATSEATTALSTSWSDCNHRDRLSQLHKNICSARLVLIEKYIELSESQSPDDDGTSIDQLQEYSSTLEILRLEICRSAQECLLSGRYDGTNPQRSLSSVDTQRIRPFSIELQNQAKKLMFPLYIAASTKSCPVATRKWVIDCLSAITNKLELSQAALTKDLIERHEPRNAWSVAATLGAFPLGT